MKTLAMIVVLLSLAACSSKVFVKDCEHVLENVYQCKK